MSVLWRVLVSDGTSPKGLAILQNASDAAVDNRPGLPPGGLLAALPGYQVLIVRSVTSVKRL